MRDGAKIIYSSVALSFFMQYQQQRHRYTEAKVGGEPIFPNFDSHHALLVMTYVYENTFN